MHSTLHREYCDSGLNRCFSFHLWGTLRYYYPTQGEHTHTSILGSERVKKKNPTKVGKSQFLTISSYMLTWPQLNWTEEFWTYILEHWYFIGVALWFLVEVHIYRYLQKFGHSGNRLQKTHSTIIIHMFNLTRLWGNLP